MQNSAVPVFLDNIVDDKYQIAALSTQRIFASDNPGALSHVFECSLTNPTLEDRGQIFYALGSAIGALDLDRQGPLNTWSIAVKDPNSTNFFDALRPLNYEDRVALYSTRHTVTCDRTVSVTSDSLFALVALNEHEAWKNGILQRIIDSLVKPEFRGKPEVYALIDQEFFNVLRFLHETRYPDTMNRITNGREVKEFLSVVRPVLRNTHDATQVVLSTEDDMKFAQIVFDWSGSQLTTSPDYGCNIYWLKPSEDVVKALSYIDTLPPRPAHLEILDAPL